jgi:hypothetical protein
MATSSTFESALIGLPHERVRSLRPLRSRRDASLSSGLDIVRKMLGQHEIATLQTAVIDQDIQDGVAHDCPCLGRVHCPK